MKVTDLTRTIEEGMPLFPGTEPVKLRRAAEWQKDGFHETALALTSHTGTHMDAPYHLFPEKKKLEDFPLSQFVGKAVVIDCRDVPAGGTIGMEFVEKAMPMAEEADFLLFLTGWGRYWGEDAYFGDYPVISMEVCEYLLKSGKKGVGFDTPGIDPVEEEALSRHVRLLSEETAVILENLCHLEEVLGGVFLLAALPLNYRNADGAPIRAAAITEE